MTDTSKGWLCSGFTLIEVVAILLLMGIVAVAVVSRMDTSPNELIIQSDLIKTHLRYAQTRALDTSMVWGISFSGNTYSLFKYEGTATAVKLPGESVSAVAMPSGIAVTAGLVAFNARGIPSQQAAGSPVAADNIAVVVSKGGSSRTITVTKGTGFIP